MSLTDDNTNGGSATAPAPTPCLLVHRLSVSDHVSVLVALNLSRHVVVQSDALSKLFRPITCLVSTAYHD
jgi:hypothetical protein